jgi:hypothetical protein
MRPATVIFAALVVLAGITAFGRSLLRALDELDESLEVEL